MENNQINFNYGTDNRMKDQGEYIVYSANSLCIQQGIHWNM